MDATPSKKEAWEYSNAAGAEARAAHPKVVLQMHPEPLPAFDSGH